MPGNYGPPPRKVTYSFRDIGEGQWRTTIEIVAPDASVRKVSIRYRRDGQPAQSQGDNVDGDSAALLSPASDVLVMSIAKDGHLGSVRTYSISANGEEMTESAASVDQNGAPFVRVFHFRRVRSS
ncbi:MAG: hypothetical protein KF783_00640 [Sphingomonas sp.]|nr:hypothetical protein [Sphingomonas sp.]